MKCPTTGKATREAIPGILLTRRFTEALADDIGRYADRTSVLEASRHHNVDYKAALAFEKTYLVRKKDHSPIAQPTRIGVDEVKLGTMGWRVVVSDLDVRRPIWIGGQNLFLLMRNSARSVAGFHQNQWQVWTGIFRPMKFGITNRTKLVKAY